MIRRWLARRLHVSEWWGDPAEQFELVSGDLDEPAMEQFIVSADGQDFAYLQCYDLTRLEFRLWRAARRARVASIISSVKPT